MTINLEVLLVLSTHEDISRDLVKGFSGIGCDVKFTRGRVILGSCRGNSMEAARKISWYPGVDLVGYGVLVSSGGKDLGAVAKELVAHMNTGMTPGDKVSVYVEQLEGSDVMEADLRMAVMAEIVSRHDVIVDDEKPDKLFTLLILRDSVLISFGYIRGVGGLPVGMLGDAVVLYSGNRGSVSTLIAAAASGYRPLPLFVEIGKRTPPTLIRKAIMSATTVLTNLGLGCGEMLVTYLPDGVVRSIEALPRWMRAWGFHRLLACMAAELADRMGAKAVFTGVSVEPGYLSLLDAYIASQAVRGIPFIFPVLTGTMLFPQDEELERVLDMGDEWRYIEPSQEWSSARLVEAERIWRASGLDDRAGSLVERAMYRIKVDKSPVAAYRALDGYASQREKLEKAFEDA